MKLRCCFVISMLLVLLSAPAHAFEATVLPTAIVVAPFVLTGEGLAATAESSNDSSAKRAREQQEEDDKRKHDELCKKFVCKTDVIRATAAEAADYLTGGAPGPYLHEFFEANEDSGLSQDDLIDFILKTAQGL